MLNFPHECDSYLSVFRVMGKRALFGGEAALFVVVQPKNLGSISGWHYLGLHYSGFTVLYFLYLSNDIFLNLQKMQ